MSVRISAKDKQETGISARKRRYRGVGLIWCAIFILLIILIVGLSLDTAKVAYVLHQMQNAADASALAGANFVKKDRDKARLQAQTLAKENIETQNNLPAGADLLLDLNEENDPNGDIVIGWYNRSDQTFTPATSDSDGVNALAVITTRSVSRMNLGGPIWLIFGAIAGVDAVDIAGYWQAKRRPYAIAMCAGGTGAGLIALSPTGRGVYLNGTTTLDVRAVEPADAGDGEIQVNSGDPEAFYVDGGPVIEASGLNVYGGVDVGNYDLTVPYNSPAPILPDPLAWLPEPTWDPAADLSYTPEILAMDADDQTKNGILVKDYDHPIDPVTSLPDPNINIPWELYPGYYSEGFIINCASTADNPVIHFNPGIYIIGGSEGLANQRPSGIVLDAQSYITSDEAMFFITQNAAATDYGVVDIAAGAGFRATEPNASTLESLGFPGVYEGVTIFQDRDNTNTARIGGSSGLELDGTLYFPSALMYLRGGGDGFGNQLIASKFDIGGNGNIGINYDGRNKAPVTTAFLVE